MVPVSFSDLHCNEADTKTVLCSLFFFFFLTRFGIIKMKNKQKKKEQLLSWSGANGSADMDNSSLSFLNVGSHSVL